MPVSGNGLEVITSYGPPALATPVIPGTDVKLLGGIRTDATLPLLMWVAEQFHLRVRRAVQAEGWWGYNYRPVRGQKSGFSNHASGSAGDFAAAVFPIGTRSMSASQRAECVAIEAEARFVTWGGHWSRPDEMHYERNGGVSDAQIIEHLNQLGNGAPDMTPEEHQWLGEIRYAMVANLVGARVAAIDGRTAAISSAVALIQKDIVEDDAALARLQSAAANTPAWRVESLATDPKQKQDEEAAVWVLVVVDDTSHRYHVPGRDELAKVWGVDVNGVTRLPATHPLASLPVWPTAEES